MENIEDPTNIVGLSNIVNKNYINSDLDIDAIEKDMVGKSGVKKIPRVDPTNEFKSALNDLSRDTGINLNDDFDLSNDSDASEPSNESEDMGSSEDSESENLESS